VLILIIAGGPDKGRIYELTDGAPIVLGREGDQVKLNDRKVSREHARLWCEGGQWYAEDLGSRHGTFRNHAPIEKNQRAKLKDGDYLQIGNTVMVLGRMTSEHMQQMALMAGQQGIQTPRRRGMLIAGGLSVAAMLGMGAYLAFQLENIRRESVPRDVFVELQQKLVDAQREQADRIAASIDRQGGLNRELLSQQEQLANSLDQTTLAMRKHGSAINDATDALSGVTDPILRKLNEVELAAANQEKAIQRVGELLAQADERDADSRSSMLAAISEMKTTLIDQPMGDKLLARLEQAMEVNAKATGEAVQTALAEYRRVAQRDAQAADQASQALMARVMTALDSVPTREQIAQDIKLAVAQASAQDEQFMRMVLAELRRTGEQITTDLTAAAAEDAGQANALMQQVVAELNKRPTGEQLAAELRTAMDRALTQQNGDSKELASLMQQVLTELEERPTSEQLASDLRRYIGEDGQRTELLVARVMSEIKDRPTAQEIALELRAADNESAAKMASLLEQVLKNVDTQEKLASQVNSLRDEIKNIPGRDEKTILAILDRLDEQTSNGQEMLASIAKLRELMPEDLPAQLDKVLAKLDEQVRTEQLTDAIEQAVQRVANANNTKTQAALDEMTRRLDALPSAQELAKIVKSQDALAELLDKSDARETLAELRATLDQIAQSSPGASDQKLSQIMAMLKEREKVALMIAELHDAIDKQSDQAESLKRELLAAVASADQPRSEEDLHELLALVRERLVTDDSIRQAIRDEMRGTLLPNQMAISDARDVNTTSLPGSDTPTSKPDEKADRKLTRLEAAYKQSFETGTPVTIGAGDVDPKTGEVSEGRLIDPAVAKALGFDNWRDWYLTDRHAEQLRLQQQALRQRNLNDVKSGNISLPAIDNKSSSQRPEN